MQGRELETHGWISTADLKTWKVRKRIANTSSFQKLIVAVRRGFIPLLKDLLTVDKERDAFKSVSLPKSFHVLTELDGLKNPRLTDEQVVDQVIARLIFHYEVRIP